MKTLAVAVLCLLAVSVLFAQPPALQWSRTFGGPLDDDCFSIQQTADGGFVLGGNATTEGTDGDFWLVRTNGGGDSLWSRSYDSGPLGAGIADICRSVHQTADGGYALGGYIYSYAGGEEGGTFWMVRTNPSGDTTWTYDLPHTDEDFCYATQLTSDGGFVMVGTTLAGDVDLRMVRLGAGGEQVGSRIMGGANCDHAVAVQQTADGGFICAGFTSSWGYQDWPRHDLWLVKTDADFNVTWNRFFGGPQDDRGLAVEQTVDGGYIVAGYTESLDAGGRDVWAIKTDANGDVLWERVLGGAANDECAAVHQSWDGGYVLAGTTESFGAGGSDFWLIKLSETGDSLWTQTFGGTGSDVCRAIRQLADGSYILAGSTQSSGSGGNDFWLVKTDPDPAAAAPRAPTPEFFSLSAYPNPFNPQATLRFTLPRAGSVSLRVFDLLGSEVAVLVNGPLAAGTHVLTFDAVALASGLYFARLDACSDTQVRKLMLVK